MLRGSLVLGGHAVRSAPIVTDMHGSVHIGSDHAAAASISSDLRRFEPICSDPSLRARILSDVVRILGAGRSQHVLELFRGGEQTFPKTSEIGVPEALYFVSIESLSSEDPYR